MGCFGPSVSKLFPMLPYPESRSQLFNFHKTGSTPKHIAFRRAHRSSFPCFRNNGGNKTLRTGKIGSSKTPLNWEARLKVAVGAARGIVHIHRQDDDKLVRCESHQIVKHAKSRVLPSVVTNTCKMTKEADVYSFGIVLLELFSRRPSQYTSNDDDGEAVSLVNWVQSVANNDTVSRFGSSRLLD